MWRRPNHVCSSVSLPSLRRARRPPNICKCSPPSRSRSRAARRVGVSRSAQRSCRRRSWASGELGVARPQLATHPLPRLTVEIGQLRRRPGHLLGVDEHAAGPQHLVDAPEQHALVVVLEMVDRQAPRRPRRTAPPGAGSAMSRRVRRPHGLRAAARASASISADPSSSSKRASGYASATAAVSSPVPAPRSKTRATGHRSGNRSPRRRPRRTRRTAAPAAYGEPCIQLHGPRRPGTRGGVLTAPWSPGPDRSRADS